MKPIIIAAVVAALAAVAAFASGCESAEEQAASTYRAASETLGERSLSDDPRVQLAHCDAALTRCERDAVGVTFLAAAYIALWVILLVFFFLVRARQRRLVLEMVELKARLARLQDRPPD